MQYSDDLDCRIYVDAGTSRDALVAAIARILPGAQPDGLATLHTPDSAIDVLRNDEFDAESRAAFPGGFLHFRYAVELYPPIGGGPEATRRVVARLLEYFWSRGIPAVAACDYEAALPLGGGYDTHAVPWPSEAATSSKAAG